MTVVWFSVLTSFVFTPLATALKADIMRARLVVSRLTIKQLCGVEKCEQQMHPRSLISALCLYSTAFYWADRLLSPGSETCEGTYSGARSDSNLQPEFAKLRYPYYVPAYFPPILTSG